MSGVKLTAGTEKIPFSSRWAAALEGNPEALKEATRCGERAVYGWLRAAGASAEEAAARAENFLANLCSTEPPTEDEKEISRLSDFLLNRLTAYSSSGFPPAENGSVEPIDSARCERLFQSDPARAPAEIFTRRWALTLLERTIDRLRREVAAYSDGVDFAHLAPFLGFKGGGEEKYEELATQLGLSVSVLRLAVYNFRRRYREVLRQVISDTVRSESDVDSELTLLLCAAG